MDALRVIKTALGISLVIFTLVGISVSFAVFDRQKALREVARYNMVWAVSQSSAEFYRFEQRVAAYAVPDSAIDKDEVQLRFDIVRNRLEVLRHGDVREFTEANPEQRETVEAFGRLLSELEPLVQSIDRPGTIPRMLAALKPFEGKLARLAAVANEYGSDLTGADQQRLIQLHWLFSGIAAALVVCGLAFIVLLFFQNRLLTKAYGFSQIISEETFGPVGQTAYREYATDILDSGQHMLELVDDILIMARLDAGRYELDLVRLELRETVDRTVNMFRGTKQAGSHSITVDPNAAWPWIEADERALRQMLLNLLSNAAKFSEPDTPIDVQCRFSSDGDVVLTVADHGIGMTSQDTAQVVNAFYQADSRIARRYEGSGLGLSIVSGLMGCHGGRLTIDSEPGSGSRISLIFPAALVCAEDLVKVA